MSDILDRWEATANNNFIEKNRRIKALISLVRAKYEKIRYIAANADLGGEILKASKEALALTDELK